MHNFLNEIPEKAGFFDKLLQDGIIQIILSFAGLIASYIYREWILEKIEWLIDIFDKIKILLKHSKQERLWEKYKLDDLIFQYYPIFNDWKYLVSRLPKNRATVSEVDLEEFVLDSARFGNSAMQTNNPDNRDRVRITGFDNKSRRKLVVRFQKTNYAAYLNSQGHLDEIYPTETAKTYRKVLQDQIGESNIKSFLLSNICGAGVFTITKDNYLLISTHSTQSKVYPGISTFTASGVLNWANHRTNANPFNGILEIYKAKIGYDIGHPLQMYGFGVDMRKLYFQFSFFDRSVLSADELITLCKTRNGLLSQDKKRQLRKIELTLENIIYEIFTHTWEPAAEVALITFCIHKYGRIAVYKALTARQEHWQERNIRNEFEYRCSSRKGVFADLTTNIPESEIDNISDKNIGDFTAFIQQKNLKHKKVLEIGSGTGRLTKKILEAGPKEIYCVDISHCMMEKHKQRLGSTDRRIKRFTNYFQSWNTTEKFDVIVCSLVIIHNKEIDALVHKLCDLTKDRVFLMEDVTSEEERNRPLSNITFLRPKEKLISAFNSCQAQMMKSQSAKLHADNLVFLEFKKD